MQSILLNLHGGVIIKDNQVDIVDGAYGFEKFVHGCEQRFDRTSLFHRKRVVHNKYNIQNTRASAWHALLTGEHVTNGDSHDHSGGDGAQVDHTTLANSGTKTHSQIDTQLDTQQSKLDGIETGATNTPLTSAAPEDVDRASAVVGVATTVARADHKHDVSVGTPVDVGIVNSDGISSSLSRSDHVHSGPVFGRDAGYQISLARSTTTSATFQTKVSLTTAAGTGTYRLSWNSVVDAEIPNQSVYVRLYNVTDGQQVGEVQIYRASSSTSRFWGGNVAYEVLSGSAKTYAIQWANDNGTTSVGISDAVLECWRTA